MNSSWVVFITGHLNYLATSPYNTKGQHTRGYIVGVNFCQQHCCNVVTLVTKDDYLVHEMRQGKLMRYEDRSSNSDSHSCHRTKTLQMDEKEKQKGLASSVFHKNEFKLAAQ